MSLHINNNYAKNRGIGKKPLLTIRAIMLEEHVDLVAGDFNGADWRQSNGNKPQHSRGSFYRRRFSNATWPHTDVGPGAAPGGWTDVCGFVKLPDSCDKWKVRLHGAFAILRETLGLRPKD